jgi:hypothetical protein
LCSITGGRAGGSPGVGVGRRGRRQRAPTSNSLMSSTTRLPPHRVHALPGGTVSFRPWQPGQVSRRCCHTVPLWDAERSCSQDRSPLLEYVRDHDRDSEYLHWVHTTSHACLLSASMGANSIICLLTLILYHCLGYDGTKEKQEPARALVPTNRGEHALHGRASAWHVRRRVSVVVGVGVRVGLLAGVEGLHIGYCTQAAGSHVLRETPSPVAHGT